MAIPLIEGIAARGARNDKEKYEHSTLFVLLLTNPSVILAFVQPACRQAGIRPSRIRRILDAARMTDVCLFLDPGCGAGMTIGMVLKVLLDRTRRISIVRAPRPCLPAGRENYLTFYFCLVLLTFAF